MSEGQGPGKGPTTTDDKAKGSTPAVRATVTVGTWRFTFAVNMSPTTGELRDTAQTVAAVVGCDLDSALRTILEGLDVPPAPSLEDAA